MHWDIALRDLDAALDLDINEDGKLTWGEVNAAWPRLAIDDCALRLDSTAREHRNDGTYAVMFLSSACKLKSTARRSATRCFARSIRPAAASRKCRSRASRWSCACSIRRRTRWLPQRRLRPPRAPRPLQAARPSPPIRTPGLIHGFGFAGVMSELNLPTSDFMIALLQFNLGLEMDQLMIERTADVAIL